MDFITYGTFINMELVLVVTLRLIGFFTSAPFFSGRYVNNYIRIGVSFILANMVVSTGVVAKSDFYNGVFEYFLIGLKEVVIGLIIGFTASVIYNILVLAGTLIDFQIGFTMATAFDPLSGTQMPITANFYYFTFTAVMLISNMHHRMIEAIVYSYKVLNLGKFVMTPDLVVTMSNIMTDMFVIAFKIASPIIGIIFVINAALGILGRTVPQMNMFVIGIPLKIVVGLFIMVLVTPSIIISFAYIFDKLIEGMTNVIQGLAG